MNKCFLLLFLVWVAGVAGAATTAVVVDLDQGSFGNQGPDRLPDVDDSATTMSEITYDFSAANSLFTEPGTNAVPIYGGYRAVGSGLISSDSYIKLSSAGKVDTRAIKPAGVTGTSMATTLLFWDSADFLTDNYNTFGNTSESRIAIDAKIVNPKGVNAIIRDGDTYYLSEGGITASGTLVVSGVNARWAPIDPADFTLYDPENTTTFGLTTNAFESQLFTNVTGVGLIGKVDRGAGNPAIIEINDMMVSLQKNGEGPGPIISQDSPFPEDSWGVYSWTRFTAVDKNSAPLIKGGPIIARWKDLEPQNGVYKFNTEIDPLLQKAVDNDFYCFINIWVAGPSDDGMGFTPEWLYDQGIPEVWCERGKFPYYFHNYVPGQPPASNSYQFYFFRLINALASHIQSLPANLRDRIVFVQCAEGATGDGYCYKGDVNAGYTQYDISREDWNVFRLDAWKEFKAAYSVDGNLQIPLLTNDDANDNTLRQWMLDELDLAIGVKNGMFSHGYQISDAQERLRKHFEFKEQAEAVGKEFFARGEMDGELNEFGWITQNQEQGLYWSAIYATHCGLNHWNVPQDAVKLSKYNDALNFFNTHAGQFNPEVSKNAFCAFYRGLDASDTAAFPVSTYGSASKSNQQRYIDICNAYSAYGAGMDDPYAATGGGIRNRSATGYNDAGWQILKENFQRHITQIDAEETSSAWWQIDDSIYGRFARGFEPSANKNAMYFDVDDLYYEENRAENDGNLSVRIIYYSEDGGSWSIKYHAQDGTMKTAQTVHNAGPGSGWQYLTINLTDALLDNGGLRGSDLIIESDGQTNCRFHLIELTRNVPDPHPAGYGAFALQYSLQEGPEGDDDDDGLSNLGEYALNGNPTNENDTGLVEMYVDSSLFTFVHASNVVDSSLVYRLFDKTSLVSGIANTNNWDSQTMGLISGDYAVVSNHYEVAEQDRLFIQLQVEQE